MKKAKVTFKGKDLYVDGEFITDVSVCEIEEIESLISRYGIQEYFEEIVERM